MNTKIWLSVRTTRVVVKCALIWNGSIHTEIPCSTHQKVVSHCRVERKEHQFVRRQVGEPFVDRTLSTLVPVTEIKYRLAWFSLMSMSKEGSGSSNVAPLNGQQQGMCIGNGSDPER